MGKKNGYLIVLVGIICLMFGGVIGYIVGNRNLNKDINSNNNLENSDNVINYSFGDVVTISKLILNEKEDYSKWYVLSDKDNIVTLYGDAIWNKKYVVNDLKKVFKKQGVIIENSRLLNEEELKLFGCDVNGYTCNKSPEWAKESITSVVSEKSVVLFNKDRLDTMSVVDTTTDYIPVIVITKSNLETAKK